MYEGVNPNISISFFVESNLECSGFTELSTSTCKKGHSKFGKNGCKLNMFTVDIYLA